MSNKRHLPPSLLALDVGNKRIGVARAFIENPFPQPCMTLTNDANVVPRLVALVDEQNARAVVVGLPRNLNSEDTSQTNEVRAFVDKLKKVLNVPLFFQDEAGTSKQARAELARQPSRPPKQSVDELAAVYILEDFIKEDSYHDLLD